MSKNKVNELKQELDRIISSGIKVDSQNLKKDMCSQFADYREWIREYVVNAYDARAGYCKISGMEDGDLITITIRDNGHGMDRKGIVDFFTLYRSVKHGPKNETIGKHGIGKLSVAAIPNQCKFSVLTSDSKEAWKAETGSLLEEQPILIKPVKVDFKHGTIFEITYKKENSLKEEMKKMHEILHKYTRFLPMDIIIFMVDEDGQERLATIHDDWLPSPERCGKTYQHKIQNKTYYITLELNSGKHEIYQNRVFITPKYNLLWHDSDRVLNIPYIDIRVDSPDFELPFGRHCLRNEDMLAPLSKYIRQTLLPDYLESLKEHTEDDLSGSRLNFHIFEELVSYMLDPYLAVKKWNNYPLFRDYTGKRYSFNELQKITKEKGSLYIEDNSTVGIDYSIFDIPVLSQHQVGIASQILEEYFGNKLINLGLDNVVLEAPPKSDTMLNEAEKNFEKCLYFYPEDIDVDSLLDEEDQNHGSALQSVINELDNRKLDGVCEEIKSSKKELTKVRWKVNYLVERDGKTPCLSHKFILKSDVVVLNLYHTEIKQLVVLSKTAPALAGHWAIALCLTDSNKVLSHLTPEAREELLFIDAMSKVGKNEVQVTPQPSTSKTSFYDLIKNSYYFNFFRNN